MTTFFAQVNHQMMSFFIMQVVTAQYDHLVHQIQNIPRMLIVLTVCKNAQRYKTGLLISLTT